MSSAREEVLKDRFGNFAMRPDDVGDQAFKRQPAEGEFRAFLLRGFAR